MNKRTDRVKIAVVAALAFSLPSTAGCVARTAGTKIVSYPSVQIVENNQLVANRLKIAKTQRSKEGGLLRVEITGENVTREDIQFEYRFRWLDQQGFEVQTSMSTWTPVYSTALDTIRMRGVAPSEAVTDFEFIVRFPDRI